MKEGLTLEEAFSQLEDIISHLEEEGISLEESFREYKDGMELLKFCNDSIDTVEKSVMKMNEEGELCEF